MLINKIVITGPESSGKTTLATLLAKKFNSSLVNEYAREYLQNTNRPYKLEDVLIMAKEQLRLEELSESRLTFLDTDLTVYAIWIKEKYNQEIDWIEAHLEKAKDKTYLLCGIDIEWQLDPLREHPNMQDRRRLFNDYKNLLEKYRLSYYIISGDIPTRIKKSKEIINSIV